MSLHLSGMFFQVMCSADDVFLGAIGKRTIMRCTSPILSMILKGDLM